MRQEIEGMGLLTLKDVCMKVCVYIYVYIYICMYVTDCIWWETSSHFTIQHTICIYCLLLHSQVTTSGAVRSQMLKLKTFSCTSTPHNPPMVLC